MFNGFNSIVTCFRTQHLPNHFGVPQTLYLPTNTSVVDRFIRASDRWTRVTADRYICLIDSDTRATDVTFDSSTVAFVSPNFVTDSYTLVSPAVTLVLPTATLVLRSFQTCVTDR